MNTMPSKSDTSNAKSMNIVEIICHDIGKLLPCYGWEKVHAPALTQLAESGVVFTNMFTAGICCTPARGCLRTSTYAHENGLVGLAHLGWSYANGVRTFVHELNDAGYHTQILGYQHEAREDLSVMGYQKMWNESWDAHDVAARAEQFFQDEVAGNEPFYLNCGFWEVHHPLDLEKYIPYRPEEVEVPSFTGDTPETREELTKLYASISYMDEAIGRILAAIDASPIAHNTAVIFTTDHGIAIPGAKGTLYDSGIGISYIARLPGGVSGEECDALLSNIDIAPSILELAGVPVPDYMRGESFLPAMKGASMNGREMVFSEKNYHAEYDPVRAVRTPRYKYIRYFASDKGNGAEELYDLNVDAEESTNRVCDPNYEHICRALRSELENWMKETGDWLPDGAPPTPPAGWPDRKIILDAGKGLVPE